MRNEVIKQDRFIAYIFPVTHTHLHEYSDSHEMRLYCSAQLHVNFAS